MTFLTRAVHLLAVGLWFGSGLFFTFVVGLSLFATFDTLTATPPEQRPLWLPAPAVLEKEPPSARFPEPLRREQGSRIAGAAVGPMFPFYYGLQAVCAALALLTSLAWTGRVDRVRTGLLTLALLTVLAGWWLEREIHALREVRSAASDAVLLAASPTPEQIQKADAARATFGLWHFGSLLQNFATLALVTVVMILAARLPEKAEPANRTA